MIAKILRFFFAGLTPLEVDGTLYASIAIFGAVQTIFSTDDAYKYVNPYWIFWIKALAAILLAGAGALKMFRSTAYAEHVKNGKTPEPTKTNEETTTGS